MEAILRAWIGGFRSEPDSVSDAPSGRAQSEEARPVQAAPSADESPAPPIDQRTAGEKLRDARLARGLSLHEVERRTRVKRDFVEALEEMDVKLLPGKAYAVPYLRSYARLLGLPEDEVVAQYLGEAALSREDARPQVRDPSSRPRGVRPWAPVAAVGAIAVGVIGWQALRHATPPDAVTVAEAAAPAAAALTEEAPIAAYRQDIEIRALAEAPLEAHGPDGTVYFNEIMHPGDVYRPDPGPGWTFHAPNGAQFEVWIDGARVGLLGDEGKPVLGRRFDQPETASPPARRAPPAATLAVVRPAG
ncbi:MAG: helix-turn-helix domain-containing protein [Alphaproteobacteria bacterium]|nr:helix-turn-helix domain-containing protein [Alphaproteobacteria bacterium]